MNIAGVPTLDIVDAIFLATNPDLPIPVSITFPLQLNIASTAFLTAVFTFSLRRESPFHFNINDFYNFRFNINIHLYPLL